MKRIVNIIFLTCIISLLMSIELSAQNEQELFELIEIDENLYLRSCLEVEFYRNDFFVPKRDLKPISERSIPRNVPNIIEGFWENDCFYQPIKNIDKDIIWSINQICILELTNYTIPTEIKIEEK